jgi:hypothetical protein
VRRRLGAARARVCLMRASEMVKWEERRTRSGCTTNSSRHRFMVRVAFCYASHCALSSPLPSSAEVRPVSAKGKARHNPSSATAPLASSDTSDLPAAADRAPRHVKGDKTTLAALATAASAIEPEDAGNARAFRMLLHVFLPFTNSYAHCRVCSSARSRHKRAGLEQRRSGLRRPRAGGGCLIQRQFCHSSARCHLCAPACFRRIIELLGSS